MSFCLRKEERVKGSVLIVIFLVIGWVMGYFYRMGLEIDEM